MDYQFEIENSVEYLASDKALECLEEDAYWPKWNSPWWHMLLLYEMGEVKRIPETTIEKYVEKMSKMPVKIFPIYEGEMPDDVDPWRASSCHCQLGNVYQLLASWGLDVDKELSWIRPWFLRCQMADGGLNCDEQAYLATNECPSSMVGTIAAFESVLMHTSRDWTVEERIFLDKGAQFLIDRKLQNGSSTNHNAEERKSAQIWSKLCFPRFYFYDVLRGLNALLIWSEKTSQPIPPSSISDVVLELDRRFPSGEVRIERFSFEGSGTLLQSPSSDWNWQETATFFPLLNKVSKVGETSPFLSKQWSQAKNMISKNSDLRGLISSTQTDANNILY